MVPFLCTLDMNIIFPQHHQTTFEMWVLAGSESANVTKRHLLRPLLSLCSTNCDRYPKFLTTFGTYHDYKIFEIETL